jgi:hypothetical protein
VTFQPRATTPTPEASAIGRLAFHALVPSLLLPVIVTASSYVRTIVSPSGAFDFDWLVIGAFCFVLLGSMTINSWLLLRHPESWRLRALPNGQAVVLLILWGLLVVATVLVGLTRMEGFTIAFAMALAVAIMVVSIVVFVFAVIRSRIRFATVPVTAVGVSPYAAVLGWGYLAITVIGVAAAIPLMSSGGPAVLVAALVVFGLPWSWPLAVIAFFVGTFLQVPVLGIAIGFLVVAAVVFNIVGVILLLTRPVARVRFVNWFFRLGGDRNAKTAIRTFAPPAA